MPAQIARASTPQPPILLRENVGSIAVLTLNRPAARNSLSEGLIAELHGALRDIHDDKSVRAVVITANGPAFSAGHDMKELTARRTDADRRRLPVGGKLRSRGRLGGFRFRHAGRRYRPVLFDADGGAVAQQPAQAGD